MLFPRIIPILLLHNGGLHKTRKFGEHKYLGDPLNIVKIFNEKMVDELVVLDIDSSIKGSEPNYSLISRLASECQMPLCYGGGIKRVEQVEKIISLGVEKISLSSASVEDPSLIKECASRVGSQSVVVTLDVMKTGLFKKYEVVTYNSTKRTGLTPDSLVKQFEELGAGEVLINSVDRDGTMIGYDLRLVELIKKDISIPVTVAGGVGSFDHIQELYRNFGIIGAGVGSFFVFKGRYRAVLISYPTREEKQKIFNKM